MATMRLRTVEESRTEARKQLVLAEQAAAGRPEAQEQLDQVREHVRQAEEATTAFLAHGAANNACRIATQIVGR